jgi:hypothetical protein
VFVKSNNVANCCNFIIYLSQVSIKMNNRLIDRVCYYKLKGFHFSGRSLKAFFMAHRGTMSAGVMYQGQDSYWLRPICTSWGDVPGPGLILA